MVLKREGARHPGLEGQSQASGFYPKCDGQSLEG